MARSVEVKASELQIASPVRWLCVGPSGVGKTVFLKNLIAEINEVFDQPTSNIIYCFATYQPLYDEN